MGIGALAEVESAWLPYTARTVYDTVRDVLASSAWSEADGEEARQWLLTLALCESLHQHNISRIVNADGLREAVQRGRRDSQIRAGFDGQNYRALAARHKMTMRQVRRIVDMPRERRHGH